MAATGARIAGRSNPALSGKQFPFFVGLIFGYVSSDGTCCNCQRACQIHLTRTTSPREVAVLGADHDLVRPRRNTRAGVDASAATGLDDVGSGALEHVQIAAPYAIFPRLLRSKLNVELYGIRNPLAMAYGIGENPCIHIHVVILAYGAGAAMSSLDRNRHIQVTN